jgi:Family of unknown function (DUF6221)
MTDDEKDLVAWLRKTIEGDRAAARIIGAGGFAPQRWDTEPPGQVNPEHIPASDQVSAALGLDREEAPYGWVEIVAYDRLNNEPPERDGRDSTAPVMLVDSGRREFDHIIRHDPRNVIADCEAKLAILEMYTSTLILVEHPQVMGEGHPFAGKISAQDYLDAKRELAVLRPAVVALASGYRHRPGYREEWAALLVGEPR